MITISSARSAGEVPQRNFLTENHLVVVIPHITHPSNPFSPVNNLDNSRLSASFKVLGLNAFDRELLSFGLAHQGYDDVKVDGERIIFRMHDPQIQYHLSEHAEVYGDHLPFSPKRPELNDAQRLVSGILNDHENYQRSLAYEIRRVLSALPDGNAASQAFRQEVAKRIDSKFIDRTVMEQALEKVLASAYQPNFASDVCCELKAGEISRAYLELRSGAFSCSK